jgi:hypothetical protein
MTSFAYDVTGASGSHTWRDPDGPIRGLPPIRYLEQAAHRVQRDSRLYRALWRERGITLRTAEMFSIGYDPDQRAWVLPIFDGRGFVCNVTWRPRRGATMRYGREDISHPMRIGGRRAERGLLPLYPRVPYTGPLLLVAGEWDALACLQHGIPAVTGLSGKLWHDAWNPAIEGRRIAVMYDVGEEAAANNTVRQLRDAGAARSWAVYLGLPNYGDDPEIWFRSKKNGGYGRDRNGLLELIRLAKMRQLGEDERAARLAHA